MPAPPLIVFDVNETLFDLRYLEPAFERLFGDRKEMRVWYGHLVMYSMALTLAGLYVPFTNIGAAVLEMQARTLVVDVNSEATRDLAEMLSKMPPWPEVPGALKRLRDAGFRLFTLTNNTIDVQRSQLRNGGIEKMFEKCFSVDVVEAFKPSPKTYAYVERELAVPPSQLCLVACHAWDTLGAVAAGWQAALIRRVGNDRLSVGPQPGIVGSDLDDVAEQLLTRHARSSP